MIELEFKSRCWWHVLSSIGFLFLLVSWAPKAIERSDVARSWFKLRWWFCFNSGQQAQQLGLFTLFFSLSVLCNRICLVATSVPIVPQLPIVVKEFTEDDCLSRLYHICHELVDEVGALLVDHLGKYWGKIDTDCVLSLTSIHFVFFSQLDYWVTLGFAIELNVRGKVIAQLIAHYLFGLSKTSFHDAMNQLWPDHWFEIVGQFCLLMRQDHRRLHAAIVRLLESEWVCWLGLE